jgi:dihydrofolate synthase / folylpolyglutamate synthase
MAASYQATISWLFGLQKFGIKLGLCSITRLLDLLDNPHHGLRCIHIAGTNGKGSTAAFLHAIYCRAGYRPGLYTSPHLIDFTERIVIGGQPIARTAVCSLVSRLRSLCRRNHLEHITFFEFTTALALMYFAEKKADPVILETGLGGRLDATNVVDPAISLITSINREHTVHLGPTLMHITREKAGIIKPNRPCISAVSRPGPRDIIRGICTGHGSALLEYGRDFTMRRSTHAYRYQSNATHYYNVQLSLPGGHQARNAALAITAVNYLCACGLPCSEVDIRKGLRTCIWPGRLESLIYCNRHVLLDGAHNPAAWRALSCALKAHYSFHRLVLIIGVMKDKEIDSLQQLASMAYRCIFFKPDIDRAAGRDCLKKYSVFSDKNKVLWCPTFKQALVTAQAQTGTDDLICITGSLFAVGEAREHLCSVKTAPGSRIGM